MENKNSNKPNDTLDSFVAFSKKPGDENNSLNFIANQSCSPSSSSSSSPIATNTLTCSSPSNHSSTDVCTIYVINSSLNTENLPLKPKSSSKIGHAGVSQTNQDPLSQLR